MRLGADDTSRIINIPAPGAHGAEWWPVNFLEPGSDWFHLEIRLAKAMVDKMGVFTWFVVLLKTTTMDSGCGMMGGWIIEFLYAQMGFDLVLFRAFFDDFAV